MSFPENPFQYSLSAQEEDEEEEEDQDQDQDQPPTIPLQHQRVFGSGVKRKRISFVPAATTNTSLDDNTTSEESTARKRKTAAERYLEIITCTGRSSGEEQEQNQEQQEQEQEDIEEPSIPPAKETTPKRHTQPEPELPPPAVPPSPPPNPKPQYCPICNLPLTTTTSLHHKNHESLLAHQLSLPHIHPPSHLDRKRMGLRCLESQGWDPDSRLGLGKVGSEGRRELIKVVGKRDTLALGVVVPPSAPPLSSVLLGKGGTGKGKKLGAKEARRLAVRERKERLVLGEKVFGNGEEVERLLYGK